MVTLHIRTACLGMGTEDLHHYPDAGDLYAIRPALPQGISRCAWLAGSTASSPKRCAESM